MGLKPTKKIFIKLNKEKLKEVEDYLYLELNNYIHLITEKQLNVKEFGHSLATNIEEKVASLLEKKYEVDYEYHNEKSKKKGKKRERSWSDFMFVELNHKYPTNVKFSGSNVEGQPNICSMRKLIDNLIVHEMFDSYHIIRVKYNEVTKEVKIYFVDILDYINCLTWNAGTGQIMLKEKEFDKLYDKNTEYDNLSLVEKKKLIINLYNNKMNDHIKQREKQRDRTNKLFIDKGLL